MVEKDHSIHWGFVGRGTAIGTAFVLLTPLIAHPAEAKNSLDALAPGYMDCGPGLTVEDAQGVLVPGAGMQQDEHGDFVANKHEEERIFTAAWLYNQNPDLFIFLLDGPPDPMDPRNGEGVVDYLQFSFQRITNSNRTIPRDKIVRGVGSINTATNMDEAAGLARTFGLERFLVVTQTYHMDRSVLFACNNGLHVTPRLVEDVLGREREYPFLIELKEHAEVMLAYVDPDGNIPTYLKANQIRRRQYESHQARNNRFPQRRVPQDIWHENIIFRNGKRKETVVFQRRGRR